MRNQNVISSYMYRSIKPEPSRSHHVRRRLRYMCIPLLFSQLYNAEVLAKVLHRTVFQSFVFEMLLSLYEEVGFIRILESNSSFYMIEFLGIDDITKVLHSEKYAQIFELIIECEEFQKSLLEDDLAQILV